MTVALPESMRHERFPPGHNVWMFGPELACESEIELLMLRAVVKLAGESDLCCTCRDGDAIYPVGTVLESAAVLVVAPQVTIGSYRVDFTLSLYAPPMKASLVVECDGHDYHDRTKEQASRDRQRDRTMQANGWTVFRFTGSDIWHDASGCAQQCLEYLLGAAEGQ